MKSILYMIKTQKQLKEGNNTLHGKNIGNVKIPRKNGERLFATITDKGANTDL